MGVGNEFFINLNLISLIESKSLDRSKLIYSKQDFSYLLSKSQDPRHLQIFCVDWILQFVEEWDPYVNSVILIVGWFGTK